MNAAAPEVNAAKGPVGVLAEPGSRNEREQPRKPQRREERRAGFFGDLCTAIAHDVRKLRGLSPNLFNRRGAKGAEIGRSKTSALFASLRFLGLFRSAAALPRCVLCGNEAACFFANGLRRS